MADSGTLPPLPLNSMPRESRRSTSSPRVSATHLDSSSNDASMPRRLSSAQQDEGALLNALEAEEERLVLLLTRKLELLRADKVKSENAAEYDTENMVLKLQRQLAQLQQQQQQVQHSQSLSSDSAGVSPMTSLPSSPFSSTRGGLPLPTFSQSQLDIEPGVVVDALKSENDQLRARVSTAEIAFTKERRLNDVLRSELIELRNRLGLDTGDLVGLSPLSSSPTMGATVGNSGSARSGSPLGRAGTPIATANRPSRSGIAARDRSDSNPNSIMSTLSSDASPSFSPPIASSYTSTYNSTSQTSYTTTPSSSYSTPQVPINTPVRPNAFRPRARSSSSDITEEGEEYTSGVSAREMAIPKPPPPSLSSSLVDPSSPLTRGARVAETGTLQRRRSSAQPPAFEPS